MPRATVQLASAVAVLIPLLLTARPALAARSCPSGVPIAKFAALVRPDNNGAPIALPTVNVVRAGDRLSYQPVGTLFAKDKKAKIAIIVVPQQPDAPARVLPARPARAPAEWRVPMRVSAIGVVLGPEGIDEKKLTALLAHDPGVVDRLADYAEQHTKVEALIQALSSYEDSAPGTSSLQSALTGFSSQYGVDMPTLDRTKPTDEQATTLLRAITPAFQNTSPSSGLAQQSGGLAAAVAALFFGPPVGLAVGGAALAGSVHSSMFPPADFQSAFTQPGDGASLILCTGDEKRTTKARVEYVWMTRVPDADAPAVSVVGAPRLPIGVPSKITVHCATVGQLKTLRRARDWRLVSANASVSVPVQVDTGDTADTLTLDLGKTIAAAGDYRLETTWDWTSVPVSGRIAVRPLADLSAVTVAAASRDRLIAGSGTVGVQLDGADLEFVDHVTIARADTAKGAIDLTFTPRASSAEMTSLDLVVDTNLLRPGAHLLTVRQVNGSAQKIPVAVHAPMPVLTGLPLRTNLGDAQQTLHLHGTGLERIERMTSPDATWSLSPVAADVHDLTDRDVQVQLGAGAHAGERVAISLFVSGLTAPVQIRNAAVVLEPRPTIAGVDVSFAGQPEVELRQGEIPSGVPAGFAIRGDRLGSHPVVELTCHGESAPALRLASGQRAGNAALDRTGQSTLFLSVDPGTIAAAGCQLDAAILNEATGVSDPYHLGRSVRLPRIESFTLSADTTDGRLYAGFLSGESLELIERTGWTKDRSWPVQGIATPVPGSPGKQTLRIALPWPSPSPHAPLFIWLRDETQARRTSARD